MNSLVSFLGLTNLIREQKLKFGIYYQKSINCVEELYMYLQTEYQYNNSNKSEICKEAQNGWMPLDIEAEEVEADNDRQNMNRLYSENMSVIFPFVQETVNEMDYDRSPIYMDQIEHFVIDDMTEKAYQNLCKDFPKYSEGYDLVQMRGRGYYGGRNSYCDLIQFMILTEIFNNRRPCRRNCCRGDYWIRDRWY